MIWGGLGPRRGKKRGVSRLITHRDRFHLNQVPDSYAAVIADRGKHVVLHQCQSHDLGLVFLFKEIYGCDIYMLICCCPGSI